MIDSSLRYVRVNPVFATMTGRFVQEHLNRSVAEVVAPEHWLTIEPILQRVLAGEKVRDQEVSRSVRLRQEQQYLLMSFFPVRLGTEAQVPTAPRIGVVSIDITERKQTKIHRCAGEVRYRSLISATT